jgi:hypothetical protein
MKKLYSTSKYKWFHLRKLRRVIRTNSSPAYHRKKKHKNTSSVSTIDVIYREKIAKAKIEYNGNVLTVPSNFSLIQNPEDVIRFISALKDSLKQKKAVYIDLFNISNITHDAIVLLLSAVIRFKTHQIRFNGNFPRDLNLKRSLISSGFFQALELDFKSNDSYTFSHNRIITHGKNTVDSPLAHKTIVDSLQLTFNQGSGHTGAFSVLIELMTNTFDHAVVGDSERKHWWLSVNNHPEANYIAFSFVDYGIGIFDSLAAPANGSILNHLKNAISTLGIDIEDRPQILKKILDGVLRRSSTNQPHRGRGLPSIKKVHDKQQISNLSIITNNVYGGVSSDKYFKLNSHFEGTFYYFEIHKNNLITI